MEENSSKFKIQSLGYALPPEQRRELLEELFIFGKDNQKPFLVRMTVLLVVSTIIASAGLLSNSSAVVIGAMLVAPMMRPVMSSAGAIILGWSKRFYQSLLLIFCMAIGAIAISGIFAFIAPDMIILPKEVLARTRPTFFDLAIALAAGAGGAYTMTRKEPSAIPGVAMAVALLPPLASSGILLVYLEYQLALKAFVLFATNFAAMIFAGAITFRAVGVKPRKSIKKHRAFEHGLIIFFAFLIVCISIPLYFYSQEIWYDAMYKAQKSEELQKWLKANNANIVDVELDRINQKILLKIQSPNPPLDIKHLYDEVYKERKIKTGRTDPFTIEIIWTQGVILNWPATDTPKQEIRQLKQNFYPQLAKYQWQWKGTQYADGHWLRPEEEKQYMVNFNNNSNLIVKMHCANIQGEFDLSQEIIKMHLKPHENCLKVRVAGRFIADLNIVSGLKITNSVLSLQLENNNGVMYFQGNKP